MAEPKIDSEFQSKLLKLSDEEFQQLRENILADGEVHEPIVTWNGVIVDGHHRWQIIQENYELLKDKYSVKEMPFPDKWSAFEWIYRNQLGRRNITSEQREILIGKMYEARKDARSFHGNQHTGKSGAGQNGQHQNEKELTADTISREVGLSAHSVRRAAQYSHGIDAIQAVSPEAAERILRGGSGVSKGFVRSIPSMPKERKAKAVAAAIQGPEAIEQFRKETAVEEAQGTEAETAAPEPENDGKTEAEDEPAADALPSPADEPESKQEAEPEPLRDEPEPETDAVTADEPEPETDTKAAEEPAEDGTAEAQEQGESDDGNDERPMTQDEIIEAAFAQMRTGGPRRVYDIEALLEEIVLNAQEFIALLERTLSFRHSVMDSKENRKKVKDLINREIVDKIRKVSQSI